jgi:hypothetical protein
MMLLTPTGYNIIGASVGHEKTSVIANNLPNIRYVLDNNILRSKIDRSLVSVYANVKSLSLNFKTQAAVDAIELKAFILQPDKWRDGASVAGLIRNDFTNLTLKRRTKNAQRH